MDPYRNPTRAKLNEVWMYLAQARAQLADNRPVLADHQVEAAQLILQLMIERVPIPKPADPVKEFLGASKASTSAVVSGARTKAKSRG